MTILAGCNYATTTECENYSTDIIVDLYTAFSVYTLAETCQQSSLGLTQTRNGRLYADFRVVINQLRSLESVQLFALKLASKFRPFLIPSLKSQFNLPSLASRRSYFKLIFLFKLSHELLHFPSPHSPIQPHSSLPHPIFSPQQLSLPSLQNFIFPKIFFPISHLPMEHSPSCTQRDPILIISEVHSQRHSLQAIVFCIIL